MTRHSLRKFHLKRTIIILSIFVILGMGLFWFSQKKPISFPPYEESPESLMLGIIDEPTSLLITVGQKKKFFQRQGIDLTVRSYGNAVATLDALHQGKIDLAVTTDYVVTRDHPQLIGDLIIATVASAQDYTLITREDSEIQYISDLEGKNIGLLSGTPAEYFLGRMLEAHQLSLKDVHLFNISSSELLEHLQTGHMDAIVTREPFIQQINDSLGSKGLPISLHDQRLFSKYYHVIVGKAKFIAEKEKEIVRFFQGLVLAQESLQRSTSQEILEEKIKLDEVSATVLKPILEKYHFEVSLPQDLVSNFEEQIRFRLSLRLTRFTDYINYLEAIDPRILQKVNPQAVLIVK